MRVQEKNSCLLQMPGLEAAIWTCMESFHLSTRSPGLYTSISAFKVISLWTLMSVFSGTPCTLCFAVCNEKSDETAALNR